MLIVDEPVEGSEDKEDKMDLDDKDEVKEESEDEENENMNEDEAEHDVVARVEKEKPKEVSPQLPSSIEGRLEDHMLPMQSTQDIAHEVSPELGAALLPPTESAPIQITSDEALEAHQPSGVSRVPTLLVAPRVASVGGQGGEADEIEESEEASPPLQPMAKTKPHSPPEEVEDFSSAVPPGADTPHPWQSIPSEPFAGGFSQPNAFQSPDEGVPALPPRSALKEPVLVRPLALDSFGSPICLTGL